MPCPFNSTLGETWQCDWAGSDDPKVGHCAGEVKVVVVNSGWGAVDYWACKRHHNLMIRAWHKGVPARTGDG